MMKIVYRKILALMLAACILLGVNIPVSAEEPTPIGEAPISDAGVPEGSLSLPCKSAILMEAETGTVLYTQNAEEAMPPASVTKIMTLLLVMEALDAGTIRPEDTVSVSTNAASMGGSQIFLKEGELMCVEDLLKSVVIASANDAAVALAEYLCGSVSVFVDRMNRKAELLGMTNTKFENATGLDDTAVNHLTSARDIAIMSRELIAHEDILKYSSIWMDTIRDGAFGLTNTNRLVRYYPGCTGLKTGSTAKAGFCVSVTAERNGMSLICVIMGAESRDVRNDAATTLLDWGFSNYEVFRQGPLNYDPIPLIGGTREDFSAESIPFSVVLPKSELHSVRYTREIEEGICAPVKPGDEVGRIYFFVGDKQIGSTAVLSSEEVEKLTFSDIFYRLFTCFLLH